MKHKMNPMHYSILYPSIMEKIKNPPPKNLRVAEVDKLIENSFNISIEELRKKSRKRDERVLPRQMWMYLLRKYSTLTLHKAGSHAERDHATVHHSVKKVNAILEFKHDPFHKKFKEVIASAEAI